MKTSKKIPYTQYDQFKLVYAFINGIRGQFILDLQRNDTTLNSTYFYSNNNTNRFNKEIEPIKISRFSLYGIQYNNELLKLENLSQYEQKGKTIYGIIGSDFFNGMTTKIDEIQKTISVSKVEKDKNN